MYTCRFLLAVFCRNRRQKEGNQTRVASQTLLPSSDSWCKLGSPTEWWVTPPDGSWQKNWWPNLTLCDQFTKVCSVDWLSLRCTRSNEIWIAKLILTLFQSCGLFMFCKSQTHRSVIYFCQTWIVFWTESTINQRRLVSCTRQRLGYYLPLWFTQRGSSTNVVWFSFNDLSVLMLRFYGAHFNFSLFKFTTWRIGDVLNPSKKAPTQRNVALFGKCFVVLFTALVYLYVREQTETGPINRLLFCVFYSKLNVASLTTTSKMALFFS